MEEIRISPTIQRLALLALLAALAAAVAGQMPEIRRYMKIESM
ncbi:MAG TPA: hypothetical protein VHI73_01075 [Solirubrobacteraceae bacterium]|jgi:uncharacterized protein DUF6893|nr:hypothetical protein [Solirubrobacteraceae bacterium]